MGKRRAKCIEHSGLQIGQGSITDNYGWCGAAEMSLRKGGRAHSIPAVSFRVQEGVIGRACRGGQGGDLTHLATSGPPILSGSSATLA